MRPLVRRFCALLFALAITTSLVIPVVSTSPMGAAAAQSDDESLVRTCTVGPIHVGAHTLLGQHVCKQSSEDGEELEKTDALETKKEIYSQLATQEQNNQVFLDSMGNYLNDTRTIARIEGKNAYIRALENGSSEPEARQQAKEAIADYYAIKQMQVLASWNSSLSTIEAGRFAAENDSNINNKFVEFLDNDGTGSADYGNMVNSTVTLTNNTDVTSKAIRIPYNDPDIIIDVNHGSERRQTGSSEYTTNSHVVVKPPDETYSQLEVLRYNNYKNLWNRVDGQKVQIQNELDTFINNTYDSYQAGQIDSSDLVDPYLGARQYAPENTNGTGFDAWTLRTMASLGYDTPENLSSIGRMNVTDHDNGATYTGILMADTQPGDGFVVGNTYNASELDGYEFVALEDGGTHELDGLFSLDEAERSDGTTIEQNETVVYRNITYETTNTSEYDELMKEMMNLTAQINARQDELRSSGGGGPVDKQAAMVLIVVIAAVALTRGDN